MKNIIKGIVILTGVILALVITAHTASAAWTAIPFCSVEENHSLEPYGNTYVSSADLFEALYDKFLSLINGPGYKDDIISEGKVKRDILRSRGAGRPEIGGMSRIFDDNEYIYTANLRLMKRDGSQCILKVALYAPEDQKQVLKWIGQLINERGPKTTNIGDGKQLYALSREKALGNLLLATVMGSDEARARYERVKRFYDQGIAVMSELPLDPELAGDIPELNMPEGDDGSDDGEGDDDESCLEGLSRGTRSVGAAGRIGRKVISFE